MSGLEIKNRSDIVEKELAKIAHSLEDLKKKKSIHEMTEVEEKISKKESSSYFNKIKTYVRGLSVRITFGSKSEFDHCQELDVINSIQRMAERQGIDCNKTDATRVNDKPKRMISADMSDFLIEGNLTLSLTNENAIPFLTEISKLSNSPITETYIQKATEMLKQPCFQPFSIWSFSQKTVSIDDSKIHMHTFLIEKDKLLNLVNQSKSESDRARSDDFGRTLKGTQLEGYYVKRKQHEEGEAERPVSDRRFR